MPKDRITRLYVEGLRTLADLSLPLDGLTVLIGENGSGKSSILEACEILREEFGDDFPVPVTVTEASAKSLSTVVAMARGMSEPPSVRVGFGQWQ